MFQGTQIFDDLANVILEAKGNCDISQWSRFRLDLSLSIDHKAEVRNHIQKSIRGHENVHGVYAFVNSGQCLYIGIGRPIWRRILRHFCAAQRNGQSPRWLGFFSSYRCEVDVFWLKYQHFEDLKLDDQVRELFERILQLHYRPLFEFQSQESTGHSANFEARQLREAGRKTTIAMAVVAYLEFHRLNHIRQNTIDKYQAVLDRFQTFASDCQKPLLSDVTPRLLDNYMKCRVEMGRAHATTRFDCVLVKSFMEWCVSREFIHVNSLAKLKFPKPNNRVERVLSAEQVCAIYQQASPSDRPIIATLALTGMRTGEARNLLATDVDLEHGRIHVVSRSEAPTKTQKSATIPIHPTLYQILIKLPRPRGKYFFASTPNGNARRGTGQVLMDKLNVRFKKSLQVLKLPSGRKSDGFVLHSLRHFFKTYFLNHGVPRHLVDYWQCHANSSNASDRYVHVVDAESQRWMSQVPFDLGDIEET